ncbi:MAG: DUF1934 domain-containing protein [Oscillospiraceae bacterium]|nr:DUF1934 domain-containing protein [Oscillospiraceae bacterium]
MEQIKKDAQIKIKGIQKIDNDSDQTDLYTQGKFYKKNDKFYIVYNETPTTGSTDGKTIIKVTPNERVLITRTGMLASELLIQTGKRNVGYYGTEFGDLAIGISQAKIDCNLDEKGGKLTVEYDIDVNSSFLSKNRLEIQVDSL